MKILFNTYPMAFHTPGGGEVQLLSYKHYLKQLNITADFFNLWSPDFNNYDIVHFFSLMSGSSPFCHFVKQLKLPLVVTSSLWVTADTTHLYPWGEIQHQLTIPDKIITNSNVENQQLSTLANIPMEKFAVVYNGVDPLFFNPVSPDIFRKHFNIDYPFILNVGNVEPRKNQLNLLKAMKQFKELKLVTIGHIRNQEYGQQCFDEGREQFVFLGPLDHDSEILRSAYAACELFALPSTLETPGLAALEAAALGSSIVVTGVGATQEYFGEHVSYVMDPTSVDEIAARIRERLSAGKNNQALSQHIKTNFAWEATVKKLAEVYQSLKN